MTVNRGDDPGGGGNILLKGPCINQAPAIIKLRNVHPCQCVIKIMKCLYCLNCPKYGHLIIRKITTIVATRCQIFGVKMYKIRCRLGLRPNPIWESSSTPPLVELTALPLTPWLHLRSPTSKGRGGEGKRREGEHRSKGGSKKGVAPPPQSSPQIDAPDSESDYRWDLF